MFVVLSPFISYLTVCVCAYVSMLVCLFMFYKRHSIYNYNTFIGYRIWLVHDSLSSLFLHIYLRCLWVRFAIYDSEMGGIRVREHLYWLHDSNPTFNSNNFIRKVHIYCKWINIYNAIAYYTNCWITRS